VRHPEGRFRRPLRQDAAMSPFRGGDAMRVAGRVTNPEVTPRVTQSMKSTHPSRWDRSSWSTAASSP
jgi:hypothetical protein